ncbi:GIY-YIG nuclease family protein [Alcaligenaceae bacterium SJ-26]|nr:GIY-YIG nuclease family protein [Alcaligenaceae bacterium SJ-26]
MRSGYIYIFQNYMYGPHVVKIGLTTREPSLRAKEIYAGATGVPMPFDMAVAYSVSNCLIAEKRAHKRLAAYRINRQREFFRISPSVAASTIFEICTEVNRELGTSPPRPYVLPKSARYPVGLDQVTEMESHESFASRLLIDPHRLQESPIGTSELTVEQIERIKIIGRIFARAYPVAHQTWVEDFSRDWRPEREIFIWEHIAKAYLSIDQVEIASEDFKKEAFSLLLMRSMFSAKDVLQDTNLRNLTRKRAKQLLNAYELKPKPIGITDWQTAVKKFGMHVY